MKELLRTRKALTITSLVLGVIAFIAATVLTVEKLELLLDPSYVPSCTLNPFISCGPVMASPQASAFGIPNSIIGMVGYGLVILINFTSLFMRLPRWYWTAYAVGVSFAMGFLVWLMFQSMAVIGALCLYCSLVWIVTILMFWLAWARVTEGTRFRFINDYKVVFITVSYLALLLAVFIAFQDYWLTLL